MNLKDVIQGLEYCTSATGCNGCPYEHEEDCMYKNSRDALRYLKILVGAKPVVKNDTLFCGHCDSAIADTMDFCPACGRMIER